jgi:hypothetical protein
MLIIGKRIRPQKRLDAEWHHPKRQKPTPSATATTSESFDPKQEGSAAYKFFSLDLMLIIPKRIRPQKRLDAEWHLADSEKWTAATATSGHFDPTQ